MSIFKKLFEAFATKPVAVTTLTERQKAKSAAFFSKMESKGYKFATEERQLKGGAIVMYDPATLTGMILQGDDFFYLPAGDYDLLDGSKLRIEDMIAATQEVAEEVMEEVEAEMGETPKEEKMGAYTLADGRTIEVGLAGEAVLIDGIPAAEGEYVTGDGLTIRVDAEGKLIEVMSAATLAAVESALSAFSKVATLEKENAALKLAQESQRKEIEKLSATIKDPRPNPATQTTENKTVDAFEKFSFVN